MEAISYKLDQFEGPLDLLLTLISKNKIDIYDIPISLLCDQYMEYITAEENADLDSSSEFLLMASELMLIKSRMLLPKDEEEEDPRAALVEAMLEYKRAKEAAEKMSPLYSTYCFRMIKEQDEISVDRKYVADHDAALLQAAFIKALREAPVNDEDAKVKFEPIVAHPRVTVVEAATSLITRFKTKKKIYLDDYFETSSRSELIAKFMAILEMLKSGLLNINLDSAEEEDGVVNASSHISVTLKKSADKEEIMKLFTEAEE